MKNILNILFLGGAKRVSLAERFISAGNQLGFHVNLFSYEIEKCVPFASVGKIIIGKLWSDNNVYFFKIITSSHHLIRLNFFISWFLAKNSIFLNVVRSV